MDQINDLFPFSSDRCIVQSSVVESHVKVATCVTCSIEVIIFIRFYLSNIDDIQDLITQVEEYIEQ